MELVSWKPDYSVEVDQIDVQHQKLVKMINDLYAAMKEGKGKEVIGKILDGLLNYTKVHFRDEEKLMAQAGYGDIPAHHKIHEEFVQKVDEFNKDFESGKVLLSIEILSFLRDWLINHIMGTDRNYISAMHDKGIH